MAVAQVVDVRVNPINTSQHVVLWGNGRVDSINCPSVGEPARWYDRIDQPVARAIHITDWSAMSGYVLDHLGVFHRFGGAPELGDSGVIVGVPLWPQPIYVDWSWDPNNAGRGVVLDGYGTLHSFGGAASSPRVGHRWTALVARKLVMDWTPGSIKAYTLDYQGGIHPDFAAVAAGAGAPYWPGQDVARHIAISNWSTGAGWTLDRFGGMHNFGGAPAATGNPYNTAGDWARVVRVLSPSDPLRFLQVWAGGQEYEWTASTPPTVTAGGIAPLSPASTVTGTTRPMLAWTYSDPQKDSQAAFEWMVFTAAFVSSNDMSNPLAHWMSAVTGGNGVDPLLRGVVAPIDFDNGSYRLYVRAQDSAGQWSAWSSRAWTQAVPRPSTPTGLTATASDVTLATVLSVSATTGQAANLVRFEWLTEDGSWRPVDGADAVPLTATTTAVDRFPPLGQPRTYRAVAYAVDPRTSSLPSATAIATVSRRTYALHAMDALIGGEVSVQGPFQWDREISGGIFQGLGAKYPTVVDDGVPKARRGSLRVLSEDATEWELIQALAESRSTVVLRDPFGDVAYCRMVGNWPQRLLEATSSPGGATPLRYMHSTDLPLVEVRPPHLED